MTVLAGELSFDLGKRNRRGRENARALWRAGRIRDNEVFLARQRIVVAYQEISANRGGIDGLHEAGRG